jgi:hypothetical protein
MQSAIESSDGNLFGDNEKVSKLFDNYACTTVNCFFQGRLQWMGVDFTAKLNTFVRGMSYFEFL